MQDIRALVFESGELEFQYLSEREEFLPIHTYQESNSNVKVVFGIFRNEESASGRKPSTDTLMKKMK